MFAISDRIYNLIDCKSTMFHQLKSLSSFLPLFRRPYKMSLTFVLVKFVQTLPNGAGIFQEKTIQKKLQYRCT